MHVAHLYVACLPESIGVTEPVVGKISGFMYDTWKYIRYFGGVVSSHNHHMPAAVLIQHLVFLLLLYSSLVLHMQVNASPSLSATTQSDRLLKCKVIHDTLQLVTPPDWDSAAAILSPPNGQTSRWESLPK